jgi:hypothetical protein
VTKRPRGFTIVAFLLAMRLVDNVAALVATSPVRAGRPALETVLFVLAIVLKAITVEALWRVRPWATRAFGSMSAVMLAETYLLMRANADFGSILVRLLFLAVLLCLIGVYINERIEARFPRPVRVPVARPPAPGRVP